MCKEMEANGQHRQPAGDCPILCITKVILYTLISMFVLYLPLGDPSVRCASDSTTRRTGPTADWPCQLYTGLLNTSQRLRSAAEVVATAARQGLYQVKLQFYSLLNKLDKKDLYRVVCCSDAKEECCGASKDEQESRSARYRARKHCTNKSARQPTTN